VLAAAVLEVQAQQSTRELMRGLLGSRRATKLHWHEMDRLQQKDAAHRVAGIEGFHVVAVGTPVPRRRQERARAACLTALVGELHGFGVQQLLIEARAPDLNRRDVATVQGARFALPKGSRFRVDHVPGSTEPLLWVADVVAGVVRASHQGSPVGLSCWASAYTCWTCPPVAEAQTCVRPGSRSAPGHLASRLARHPRCPADINPNHITG
jgi:hypothetical protein